MVAESKESMTKIFETMNDAFRSAFETGRRAQETWFKAGRDAMQQPADANRLFAVSEQIAREWVPIVQKNAEAAVNVLGANLRAGMDVFNTACEMTIKPQDGSLYDRSRRFWDTAFDVARANMDFMTRAAARSMENCAAMCEAFRPEPTTAPKTGGARPSGN
jgi:hypothetical protein